MRGRRRWCGGSTGVLVGFFPSLSRLRSRFPFPRCTEIAVNLNIISSAKEQRTGNIFRLVFTNKKKKTSVEYTYYRKALLLVYNRLQERYRSPERKGSEAASHVLVVYFLHLLAFSPLLWAARYDQPPISLKESKWMRPPLHWAQLCLFFPCSLYYYLPIYIQFILLPLHRPLIFHVWTQEVHYTLAQTAAIKRAALESCSQKSRKLDNKLLMFAINGLSLLYCICNFLVANLK